MLGQRLNPDESGVIPINSMYEKGHDEVHAATTSDGATLKTNETGKASPKKSPTSKSKGLAKAPSKDNVKKPDATKGTLILTVKNADLTRDTDIMGKQDPFVKLDLFN